MPIISLPALEVIIVLCSVLYFEASTVVPLYLLYKYAQRRLSIYSSRRKAIQLFAKKPQNRPLPSLIVDYMGPPVILEVPTDVFREIALYLTVKDLSSLERTCKIMQDLVCDDGLWRAKIIYEYGHQGFQYADQMKTEKPEYPWRTLYAAMAHQWKFFCAQEGWGVIWRKPMYWRVENCPESEIGKSLNLNQSFLWWLHVFRSIRIAAGTYRLVWGLHIMPQAQGIANVEFNVRIADEERKDEKGRPERLLLSSVKLGEAIVNAVKAYNGWVEIEMAEFYVPPARSKFDSEWQTILVEIHETGQQPKSGLRVDGHEPFSSIQISPYADHGGLVRLSEVAAMTQVDGGAPIVPSIKVGGWDLALVAKDLARHINVFDESSGLVY